MRESTHKVSKWCASARNRRALGTLAIAIGVVVVVGCASNMKSQQSVEKRTASLGDPHLQTSDTLRYMHDNAQRYQLPEKYLSEARVGLSDIEQKLDTARAAEIERDAVSQQRTAYIQSKRQKAVADEDIALAEAKKLKTEYSARNMNVAADLAARERNIKAEFDANLTVRTTLAKEGKSTQHDLISQAEKQFAEAQARLDTMRAIRSATEKEGLAEIDQMREAARATRSRADATVAALRTEADSVGSQTQAHVTQILKQIDTVREQSQAHSQRLHTQAESVERDGIAQSQELIARADSLEEQASQKEYELKIASAKAERQKSEAVHDKSISNSRSQYEKAIAEIERLRGDANVTTQMAESKFNKHLSDLDSWLKEMLAEVNKIRAKSDRLEQFARGEFVKAEAEARANAMRETAAHQEALADAQMNQIIADAEAEAARIREEIAGRAGPQVERRPSTSTSKTGPNDKQGSDLHDVPDVPQVSRSDPADRAGARRDVPFVAGQGDARARPGRRPPDHARRHLRRREEEARGRPLAADRHRRRAVRHGRRAREEGRGRAGRAYRGRGRPARRRQEHLQPRDHRGGGLPQGSPRRGDRPPRQGQGRENMAIAEGRGPPQGSRRSSRRTAKPRSRP
jgi:hypothetical protein